MPKLNGMAKVAKGTSQHTRNGSKHDDLKKSKCQDEVEDDYDDEESVEDVDNADEFTGGDDTVGSSTSGDDENGIDNYDSVCMPHRDGIDNTMVSAKGGVTSVNGENDDFTVPAPTNDKGQINTVSSCGDAVSGVNNGNSGDKASQHTIDNAIGAAENSVTSVKGGNDDTMLVTAAQTNDKDS